MQNPFDSIHRRDDLKPERLIDEWKTKPSDRFVLRWVKINLSARITPRLIHLQWLRPWMITLLSTAIGVFAGGVFALGLGWLAGFLAAFAQVLDGVDGQFSRLAGVQTNAGAFLDSVLDRYFDVALMIGLVVYLIRLPADLPIPIMLMLAFLAVSGSVLISYTTARAESLGLSMGQPTLASKGTRTSMVVLCAWASFFWPAAPLLALIYLAVHPNIVVLKRIFLAYKDSNNP
jgi:phosphatidylglycerophosphate synthase